MIDRDWMLNRLKSRAISKQNFNYDVLSAPPIYSMFSQQDIEQLHYYASSAKFSAKLKHKYEAIDKIMTNRGFEKLVSGTNRVSYAPKFANNFIVKVAYDTVALNDSLREYQNQWLIRPFCTKVFEVTPCGTLGVFEKVNPVTSVKEYISMAADIYRLLNEFVIGDYIIDDIGTNYYQNIGYRNGFGPVVLDFPYVYEVDFKKIWCVKPDYKDPTGYCNGPIDYDDGFNKLICKKCGAVYKPFELAKKGSNKIIRQKIHCESEERNMKIKISGGSLGAGRCEEIITGDFRNPVKSIISSKINKKVEKQLKEEAEEKEEEESVKTVNGVATPKKEEAPKEAPKEVKDAFSISEEDAGKGDLGYMSDDKKFEKALQTICNIYNSGTPAAKKDFMKMIKVFLIDIFNEDLISTMEMIHKIISKSEDVDDAIDTMINVNSSEINDRILARLLQMNEYYITSKVENVFTDEDEDSAIVEFSVSINNEEDKTIVDFTPVHIPISNDDLEKIGVRIHEAGKIDDDFFNSDAADGYTDISAEIISRKDIFPEIEKKGKIIVIKNDNRKYLTINGKILAIDMIDDKPLKDVSIVPADWYEEALEFMEKFKEAPTGSIPEEEIEEEEASGEEE